MSPDGSDAAPLVLAVDASTTACKAIAFDVMGTPVATGRAPISTTSPAPGWQEQDARQWWRSMCEAIHQVLARVPPGRLRAISIAHQRETFVCLDRAGDPLRSAIAWFDTRATGQVRRLASPDVHQRSGKPASTIPSLYKLAWLAEHEPALLRSSAMVADVHAYLVWQLTGRHVTTWTGADPMGLLDLSVVDYDRHLLAIAGLRSDQLPEIVAPGSVIATVSAAAAGESGLPVGLPVVAGGGDGQLAGLGAAVSGTELGYLNLGTGTALGVDSERYLTDPTFRTLSSPLPRRWVLENLVPSGGLSIAWFRSTILGGRRGPDDRRLGMLADRVPPGADGLMFLPHLTGVEMPVWDPNARAAWVGLRDRHRPEHLYRAMLEAIGFELRLGIARLERRTGRSISTLRTMGGGSRNEPWIRWLAAILARPIETNPLAETTALGAGVLAAAGVALGGERDIVASSRRMTGTWHPVEPDPALADRYVELADRYGRLYPALAPLFEEIASDAPERAP